MIRQYCSGNSTDGDMSVSCWFHVAGSTTWRRTEWMIWGHIGVLQLAFCISFQRREGRNGRIRSGWSDFRCHLQCSWLAKLFRSGIWSTTSSELAGNGAYSVYFSLFLTERLPHQQMRQKVKINFKNKSWNTNRMFCLCVRHWVFPGSTIFAGLSCTDSLCYHI